MLPRLNSNSWVQKILPSQPGAVAHTNITGTVEVEIRRIAV
jgi:hypothetical protein